MKVVDEIYEKYKCGEIVYLACWCKKYSVYDTNYKKDFENSCHGDVIVDKLRKRLLKEKINLKMAGRLAHDLNERIGDDWDKISGKY